MCYTTNANSKKAVPVLSPAEKVIASIFDVVTFSVVPKNHLIIFLFLRLSIGLFQKIFFIFPLDKAGKIYIMYAVCFTWIVCHVLQMVDKRPIFS